LSMTQKSGKRGRFSKVSTIAANTIVAQTKELVSSDLDGETVLLSIETGKYYNMDPIGSRIWKLIEEPRSVSQLINILLNEFEVEKKQCEQEVLTFLNKLAGDHLIQVLEDKEQLTRPKGPSDPTP
jgi:hypothetical protein